MAVCPLCLQSTCGSLPTTTDGRRYYICSSCDLHFLDPRQRLSRDEERARYLQHENDVMNSGYRNFVQPLVDVIRENVPQGSSGLDYGCGTGPVVTEMLKDSYDLNLYDPFFAPNTQSLERIYDFVFSCEVAEHFYAPATEFQKLRKLVRAGGVLATMTWLYEPGCDFENWLYRRDPTHVVFYSERTFEWISRHFGFRHLRFKGSRLILLFG